MVVDMWSADGDGNLKSDQEMTNILNSLRNRRIRILQPPVDITLECKLTARFTMIQDSIFRGLGAPIGTIPTMLNTSIQNNGYDPSKNLLNGNTH